MAGAAEGVATEQAPEMVALTLPQELPQDVNPQGLEPSEKGIVRRDRRNPLMSTTCPELDVRYVGNGEPCANLYISNLPGPQVAMDTLMAAFSRLGLEVAEMKALPSTSGPSHALVKLTSIEGAEVALRHLSGQSPGSLGLQASAQLESQDVLLRKVRTGADAARTGQAKAATLQGQGAGVSSGAARENYIGRPAETSMLKEGPLHLVVNIIPGAVVTNRNRPTSIDLHVYGLVGVADIKRKLLEAGLCWGPLVPRGSGPLDTPVGHDLDGARLLFRGMPLKLDVAVQDQGVVDGSELRLVRATGGSNSQRDDAPVRRTQAAPRGLLMNPGVPAWQPGMTRRGPEDFFEAVSEIDPAGTAHMSELAVMKKGRAHVESVFTVQGPCVRSSS